MAWENDHCQRICSGNFRNLAMVSKASKKLVGAQESTTHSHKGGLRPGQWTWAHGRQAWPDGAQRKTWNANFKWDMDNDWPMGLGNFGVSAWRIEGLYLFLATTELVTWWLSNPAILEVKTLKGLGTLKSRSPSAQLNNSDESLLPLESMLHPNHLQPPNHLYSTRSCNPMLIGNISHVLFVKYVKFSPVFMDFSMDFSMVNPWFLLKIPRMKTAMFSQPAANWCSPWRRLGTSALGWGIWR